MPFCHIDYASFAHIAHFSHYPSGTRFCPFLSSLMAFEGVSCYHRTLRPLKFSTIGSCSPPIFHFPRNFLKKRGSFLKKRRSFSKKRRRFSKKRRRFSKKRRSFFSVPSEGRFLTANRNTNKTGNGRAASLEVQPLMARTDHFQAWTHNCNITRAKEIHATAAKVNMRTQKQQKWRSALCTSPLNFYSFSRRKSIFHFAPYLSSNSQSTF